MKIKSIKQVKNLKDKRVLVRADYNLSFKQGKLDFSEDFRIEASIPTIEYLLKKGAAVVLISHLGRPDGRRKRKLTLAPIAKHLSRRLKKKVVFLKDNIEKKDVSKKIKSGVYLLENIRFYKGEQEGDGNFAQKLAAFGDIYVNDGFSVSHRPDASVYAIQNFLPSFAGLHLEKEIMHLSKLLPRAIGKDGRPYVALMGGAKISTKIDLINNLLKTADNVLLGGALISDILKQRGYEIGNTFVEDIPKGVIRKIYKNEKIVLPVDVIIGQKNSSKGARIARIGNRKKLCGKNEGILDIGPETVAHFSKYIKKALTLVWNGPMGYFENISFAYGTFSLARLIASRGKGRAYAVVGGGETISALNMTKMEEYIDWISTGGGAMLAYLAGEKMPGLQKILK